MPNSIAHKVFYSAVNRHGKSKKFQHNPRHYHAVARKCGHYLEKETKFVIIYQFDDGSMLKVTNRDAEVI